MAGQFGTIDERPHSLARAVDDAAGALAGAWPGRLAEVAGDTATVDAAEALKVVTAFSAALDDDLAPIIACFRLDAADADSATMVDRLDNALRRLEALRLCARDIVGATPAALDAAVATLARQLAVQATATLAFRTAAADERARAGTESMAVTVHELRRPLTVISSYTQLLNQGALGDLDDRVGGAVRAMLAASEVMLRLVESLAAVGRLEDPSEPHQMADLDVHDVVRAAVDEVSTEADLRDIDMDVDEEGDLRMRGDRERLTLALTNLLSNAVKHTDAGGRVDVSVLEVGDAIVMRVRDRGPGFSPGTAERLFEKYYRDPAERLEGVAGTGLGLYIVQAVADRHGGTVSARDAHGGGAEFELRFPRR